MKESRIYLPEGYSISVARNTQQIEAIRDIWERLQVHPNSEIDFYLTTTDSLSHIIRPHVILLSRHDVPLALAVGRIENFELKFNFGYKTIYEAIVCSFVLIYGGIIGDSSNENCKILMAEFLNMLEQGEAELIFLSNMKEESHLYNLSTTVPGYLSRDHMPISNTHWRMTLPQDMASFLKARSSKHRYWLRRLERVLDKDYPQQVTIKYFFEEKDLAQLFADAESISQKTYQRQLDAGFIDNEATRKVFSLLVNKSLLRAYILYIEDKPSAYWIGRRYGDTFYLGTTGYDPAFKNYEPGTILFLKMLEDLFSIKEVKFIDFGFGDALYKNRFGDQSWQESSIYIFPRSLRGISLNVARSLTSISYQLAVMILKRTNLLEKVKKLWRSILSKKTPGTSSSDKSEPHQD